MALLVGTTARAQQEDPDTEIARRRFAKGIEYYAAQDYEKALGEFEAARRVKAAPALDYNVARCFDRLERLEEAIREYEKYVAAMPNAQDTPGIKERIAVLRARAASAPKPVLPPQIREQEQKPEPAKVTPPPATLPEPAPTPLEDKSSTRPGWGPSIGLGVAALAVGIAGAGTLGSVGPAYRKLETECGHACAPKRVESLAHRATAGYALLGITGALVVADVVVIAITAKRRGASYARVSGFGWSF